MATRRRKAKRPVRRRVPVQVAGWKHPVCYLTHRGQYEAGDLIEWVIEAILAAGGDPKRWQTQSAAIDTCGEDDEAQGEEGMRELLLLAHKFVDIR